jgi:hypothetical protein
MEIDMLEQPCLPGLDAPDIVSDTQTPEHKMMQYPDLPGEVLCNRAKELGLAAEFFVDSILTRLGVPAAQFGEHSAFDRLIWIGGRCLRLQIKSRHRMSGSGYHFEIRKGYQRGPVGTRPYDEGEFDLLALVGLPHDVVRFTCECRPQHRIAAREIPGLRSRPGLSLAAALADLGLDPGAVPTPTV